MSSSETYEASESQLEAFARENYPNAVGFVSLEDYHVYNLKRCIQDQWQLLEYTIVCILVHYKGHPAQDVFRFLKVYPWTKDTAIAVYLQYFEFQYSWYTLILQREVAPSGCGHPDAVLAMVDEGQIHRSNTQFRYWQAAGERSWQDHFAAMSPHMWFGPQGQERQRRLSIPGFSDEV